MAKKALIQKQQAKPKFKVRAYTRCRRCGRARAVYRKFGAVSHLLPGDGARGRDPRHHEVVVVRGAR